jgi:hypothetical protein
VYYLFFRQNKDSGVGAVSLNNQQPATFRVWSYSDTDPRLPTSVLDQQHFRDVSETNGLNAHLHAIGLQPVKLYPDPSETHFLGS